MGTAHPLGPDESSPREQVEWISESFREVLRESGSGGLAESLTLSGEPTDLPADLKDKVGLTQAYSIWFQLLGMADQNGHDRDRQAIERRDGVAALPALWGDSIRQLLEAGWSAERIAERLPKVQVELVLTAHPTEAKRATVLAHHRRLFERLQQHQPTTGLGAGGVASEQEENDFAVRALLAILWRTGEIYPDKPDIQSERRNVIDYLTQVFPSVLRPLDQRLRQAWTELGLDATVFENPLVFPKLTFGTWVGGDRDGHPLVTAEVTRQSLMEMRRSAIALIHRQLLQLARLLSLSDYWKAPDEAFRQTLEATLASLGEVGQRAKTRNPNEPWRQFINAMLARLPRGDANQEFAAADPAPSYQRASELLDDLSLLYKSLCDIGQRRVAEYAVQPLMRVVQTFGFHLAVLDVRQNSAVHDRAVEQLLAAAGFERTDFSNWSEEDRLEMLRRELASRRPFARPDVRLGVEADASLSALRVLRDHRQAYGDDGLGAIVISMTRNLSDLLVVYLLAREVGLMEETPEGLRCPLPVVPLFETVDDLQRSPHIYEAFLRHPITRRSLTDPQTPQGEREAVGQVMIGYSDSNKDGGILASLVSLRSAQKRLIEVGDREGVRVRFFHGRGGTISRGAGPTDRFVKSLPHASLRGDLRLTEQGETIAQKYAHQSTAIFNLELILAGVTRQTLVDRWDGPSEHALEPVLTRLAEWARDSYTELLQTEGFVTFFRQATPIEAIEASRIGSRPARRSGKQTLADLRAIPWVFSWGQARFFLSGWYGVGTALAELRRSEPATLDELIRGAEDWPPLDYLVNNVSTSLLATDVEIMWEYASMVEDEALRERCMAKIEAERRLTQEMIELVLGGPLAERRANTDRAMALRRGGLRVLHRQQLALLKEWRGNNQPNNPQSIANPPSIANPQSNAELLNRLLLSVNAIASGLGATG